MQECSNAMHLQRRLHRVAIPSKSQHLIYNTYVADEHLYVHRIGGVVSLYMFPQHTKVLPPPPRISSHIISISIPLSAKTCLFACQFIRKPSLSFS